MGGLPNRRAYSRRWPSFRPSHGATLPKNSADPSVARSDPARLDAVSLHRGTSSVYFYVSMRNRKLFFRRSLQSHGVTLTRHPLEATRYARPLPWFYYRSLNSGREPPRKRRQLQRELNITSGINPLEAPPPLTSQTQKRHLCLSTIYA